MATKSLDGNLIKKAHAQHNYTQEELLELDKCLDPIDGPLYFCKKFLQIQHPVRGAIPFDPYPYQERLIRAFHDHTYSIAMLPRQMGKALCLDTDILTPNGFVKMGDLEVGDVIYGPNGKPTNITYITDTMLDHKCYEVTFTHGETILADANHLWTWYDTLMNDLITDSTEYLLKRFNAHSKSVGRISIDHTKVIQFEKKELPIDPYLVGLWLACNIKRTTALRCNLDDFPQITEMLESNGFTPEKFRFSKTTKNPPQLGRFYVPGLNALMFSHGFKSQVRRIPSLYAINDTESRVKLLQGIFDNLATVSPEGNCSLKDNNLGFLQDIREILSSLGIKSKLGELNNIVEGYCLYFNCNHLHLFTYRAKLDRALARQYWITDDRIHIESIKPANSVPVRCLQVDNKSRLFLAGRTLVPTHNTTCASGYLLWYTMFVPEAQVLIAAHKYAGAQDIMNRYRFGYENLPDFIRAGVYSYNRNTIEYDNGARIQATTTTENTGRGKSLSLIYCLAGNTNIKVRNKETLVEETISLEELHQRLSIN